MIRIIEITPRADDAMSYYRSRGPLSRLDQSGEISLISIVANGSYQVTWAELSLGDILFIQRGASDYMLDIVELAKSMNMPVWVDYDDYLLKVPKWNKARDYYSKPEIEHSIIKILSLADVVTVTTFKLKELFIKYNENTVVIPNAVDDYFRPEPNKFSNNNKVLWRGSSTHTSDLYAYKDKLNTLMKMRPSDEFYFFGHDQPFLDNPDNKKVIPNSVDIFSYFNTLHLLNASFGFIVLENNVFNEAKSNIGWLEMYWSGGICLWPEFNKFYEDYDIYESVATYKKGNFINTFNTFRAEADLTEFWKKGIDAIKAHFLLSKTNMERLRIIKFLKDTYGIS